MKLLLIGKIFLITVVGLWIFVVIFERLFIAGKIYKGEKTAHLEKGEFFTPNIETSNKSFKDLLKWNTDGVERIPWNEPYSTDTISLAPFNKDAYSVRTTFINHATVLIETKDTTIITDPIFSKRASPFSFMGPARHHDPYLPLLEIPSLDYVLISHAHYDHLSIASIKMIEERFSPIYILPLNNGQFLEKAGVPKERITEVDLFETIDKSDMRVTLEKAKHWSARGFSDRKRYLWGSFIIEVADKKIFFAGDTGYDEHFKELRKKYEWIDLALLPIGAYEPRWFMEEHHMNPEDAIQAGKDLGEPAVIGIHFGTFKITDEGRRDPENHTKEALGRTPYGNTFLVPTIKNGLQIEVR